MKKIKLMSIILNNNTSSTPSEEAEAEAHMHFTLEVQSVGSKQVGGF